MAKKASNKQLKQSQKTENFKEQLLDESANDIEKEKKRGIKKQLLESADRLNKTEQLYGEMFDEKLSKEYAEFRKLKEHNLALKKFMRILLIIFLLIAFTLLLFMIRV